MGERLVIVGTVHVDPGSIEEARNIIRAVNPNVVALELDAGRWAALVGQQTGTAKGQTAWLGPSALLLGLLERVAGHLTGSMPGKEMLGAAEEASRIGARIALVDMPIQNTVGLMQKIPVKEKLKLGLDSIGSLLILGLGFGTGTSTGLEELSQGGERLTGNIGAFKKRYPALSKLLIDTREEHMATGIGEILQHSNGMVVAIVGLGHLASLSRRLENDPRTRDPEHHRSYGLNTSWTVET